MRAVQRAHAIALLALLSGAVSMTRAVDDLAFQDEIAEAVRRIATGMSGAATRMSGATTP